MLTVHFLPVRGVNSAEGFDVSSSFPFVPNSRVMSSPRLFLEGGCSEGSGTCEYSSSSNGKSKIAPSFFSLASSW
jgi:hypothetical protein